MFGVKEFEVSQLSILWLVVGGEDSTPSLVALSSATVILLSFLAYAKNSLLATSSQPERGSVQGDNFMDKVKAYISIFVASFIEVALALAAGHQAAVGPLAKEHCKDGLHNAV